MYPSPISSDIQHNKASLKPQHDQEARLCFSQLLLTCSGVLVGSISFVLESFTRFFQKGFHAEGQCVQMRKNPSSRDSWPTEGFLFSPHSFPQIVISWWCDKRRESMGATCSDCFMAECPHGGWLSLATFEYNSKVTVISEVAGSRLENRISCETTLQLLSRKRPVAEGHLSKSLSIGSSHPV